MAEEGVNNENKTCSANRRRRLNRPKIAGDVLAMFYGVNIHEKDSGDEKVEARLPESDFTATSSQRPTSSAIVIPDPMSTPVSRRSSRASSQRSSVKGGSDITLGLSQSMLDAFDDTAATRETSKRVSNASSARSRKSSKSCGMSVVTEDVVMENSKQSSISLNLSQSMLDAFCDTVNTINTTSTASAASRSSESNQARSLNSNDGGSRRKSSGAFGEFSSMVTALEESVAVKEVPKCNKSQRSSVGEQKGNQSGVSRIHDITLELSQSMLDAFDDTVATNKTRKSRASVATFKADDENIDDVSEREETPTPQASQKTVSDMTLGLSPSMLHAFDDTVATQKTSKSRMSTATMATAVPEIDEDDVESDTESVDLFSGVNESQKTPLASESVNNLTLGISKSMLEAFDDTMVSAVSEKNATRRSTVGPVAPNAKSRLSTLNGLTLQSRLRTPVDRAGSSLNNHRSNGQSTNKRNRSALNAVPSAPSSATSTPISKRAPTHFRTPQRDKSVLDATISAGTQTSFNEATEQTQTSDILAQSPYPGEPMEIDPRTPTTPRRPSTRKSVGFRQNVQIFNNSREFVPLKDSTHQFDNSSTNNSVPMSTLTGVSLPSTLTQSSSISLNPSVSVATGSTASDASKPSEFIFAVPSRPIPQASRSSRLSSYMAATHSSDAKRSFGGNGNVASPLCSKNSKSTRRTISYPTTISSQSVAHLQRPFVNFADPKYAQMRKEEWQKTPPAKFPPVSRFEREQQRDELTFDHDEHETTTGVSTASNSKSQGNGVSLRSEKANETFTVPPKLDETYVITPKGDQKTYSISESSENTSVRSNSRTNQSVLTDSNSDNTTNVLVLPQLETPKFTPRQLPRKSMALTALNAYGTPFSGRPSLRSCAVEANLTTSTVVDSDEIVVESSRRSKQRTSEGSIHIDLTKIVSPEYPAAKPPRKSDDIVDDSLEVSTEKLVTENRDIRTPPRPVSANESSDEEIRPRTPNHLSCDLDSSVFTLGTPGRDNDNLNHIDNEPMDFEDEDDEEFDENHDPEPSSSGRDRIFSSDSDVLNKTNVFDAPLGDTVVSPENFCVLKEKRRFILAAPKIIKPASPELGDEKLRRSTRTRVPRLQNHLGQRIEYERGPDGFPVIAGVSEVEIRDRRAMKYMTVDPKKLFEKETEEKRQRKKQKEFAKQQRAIAAQLSD